MKYVLKFSPDGKRLAAACFGNWKRCGLNSERWTSTGTNWMGSSQRRIPRCALSPWHFTRHPFRHSKKSPD